MSKDDLTACKYHCLYCNADVEYDRVLEKYHCRSCGYTHVNNYIDGGSLCVLCEIGFVDRRGGCNYCDTSVGKCPNCQNEPTTIWRISGECTSCDPPCAKDEWSSYQQQLKSLVDIDKYISSNGEDRKRKTGWKACFNREADSSSFTRNNRDSISQ